jgi:hypothetical protein
MARQQPRGLLGEQLPELRDGGVGLLGQVQPREATSGVDHEQRGGVVDLSLFDRHLDLVGLPVDFSCAGEPVRKRHPWTIPCSSGYARTSAIEVAARLASIPSSATRDEADPSIAFASSIAVVVSGQIVVHSESVNARITTSRRKDRSDTRLPN